MTLVGDADRDRALALLRRHYAEGRFDQAELTRRVGVALGARSTTDLWLALRGLPNALIETLFSAHPVVRTAKRAALAAIVSVAWLCATMMLVVAYAISLFVSGPSTVVAGVFALSWLLVTWGSWQTWRRGSRRA